MARAIKTVAIAGGGITAWSAAAALKRRIRALEVVVISSAPPPDALTDRISNTLPSIAEFHSDIGLSDEDTIVHAGSSIRAGTTFRGWAAGLPDYTHAYGAYGVPVGGVPFHQLWLRDYHSRGQPFDSFSPVAVRGSQVGHGLRLSIPTYRQLMHDYSLHLGVAERGGQIADVGIRGSDGFIEALVLEGGQRVEADLFIDCTGPAARVRSSVGGPFEQWNRWLLCDRVIIGAGEAYPESPLLDEVIATEAGWDWLSPGRSATEAGSVFSSAHRAESGGATFIRQGRLAEPWLRNCVAIGDAAVMVEPLEWTNLHLAHSQIDRLVAMMPDAQIAPIEVAEYNRQCNAEADRIRDFLCMHYLTARRGEPFWRDAAAVEPPPSLAHSLSLFSERGRLPYYEEETFARDSWLAVLFGHGFRPRRIDPLADAVPPEQVERALASHMGQPGDRFSSGQPSYRGSFLQMGQNAQ